jgi:hypothetical protein
MKSETKRDAFIRLAESRTDAVIKKIRVLSNCANPYAYEYSEEDVQRIFAAIEEELRIARAKFSPAERRNAFRLRE